MRLVVLLVPALAIAAPENTLGTKRDHDVMARRVPPHPIVTPRVKVGPSTSETLPTQQIDRVVIARSAAFRSCYRTELQRFPGLEGKVVVQFGIRDGVPHTIQIDPKQSSLANERMHGCIARTVAPLRFGRTSTDAHVSLPLVFTSVR